MNLTQAEVNYIAARAQWYFDVTTSPRNSPLAKGDACTFTGQGLSDLNRTIGFVSINSVFPQQVRVICEIGATGTVLLGNAFPKYKPIDIQDIYAIKEAFIAYYGSVDRPSAFRSVNSGAFQTSNGTVLVPVNLSGTQSVTNSDPSKLDQNG